MASAKHPKFHEADGETAVLPPRGERAVGAFLRILAREPIERRLGAGVCRVGSGPDNDVVIDDRTVSRAHAAFSLAPEGVRVEDLGSRNGTFYLGSRVETIVLGLGARLELGSVTVVIEPDTEALLDNLDYEGEGYRGILGTSPRIRKLFALLQRLESSLATVLVEGESGVGKEEVARAIHEGSPVAGMPLVALNCGAIAKELVASELFGHRRGAFTGAVDSRKGAFETANGGTLFLDEIGELPLELQPAILRALEAGEVRPLGTDDVRRVKVRVVAATNRDLEAEVAQGRFRKDLFYRLAVVRVQVPPLRGRPDDIALLAHHFARQAGVSALPPTIVAELASRLWPGNARELRNAVQSYAAIGDLPAAARWDHEGEGHDIEAMIDPTEPYAEQRERLLERFTKGYIRALLRYTNGNQTAAARVGKLDRTYISRLMAKYGLNVRKVD